MQLLLMRHGAVADGVFPDGDCPLSNTGREDAARTGRMLRSLGEKVTHVFSSPLVRARETAELVAAELGCGNRIVMKPWLAHGADAGLLQTELSTLPRDSVVLITAHQPDMSVLAALFLGSRGGQIAFSRGTVAKLLFDDKPLKSSAVLEYLLPPSTVQFVP